MRRPLRDYPVLAIVLVATVVANSTSKAADPSAVKRNAGATENIEATVKRLLSDLDANSRKTRAEAERSLLELGPKVLELLPAPAQLTTPATREAVRRIRVELELKKATVSVKESRATLVGTQTVEAALQQLSKQTGNSIDADRLPAALREQKIALKFKDVSFWHGLDELSRTSGIRVDGIYSSQLRMGPAGQGKLGADESAAAIEKMSTAAGPFRIAVRSAQLRPKLGENNPRRLRFELSILGEPRLRPLFLTFAAADFAAITKSGKVLAPSNPSAKIEQPFGVQGALVQIDFDIPDALTVDAATLRGKFSALTAAAPEKFEFTDVFAAKGISRRRGGVTVTVDHVEKSNGGEVASITIIVAYDTGGPAFESHRSWYFQNNAWMETGDRKRIEMSEPPRTDRQSDGALTVEYRFSGLSADAAGARFVYIAPTLLIDVPVAFELPELKITPRDP